MATLRTNIRATSRLNLREVQTCADIGPSEEKKKKDLWGIICFFFLDVLRGDLFVPQTPFINFMIASMNGDNEKDFYVGSPPSPKK